MAALVDTLEGGEPLPLPDDDSNGIPNYLQADNTNPGNVLVYEGISPNGDGKNDFWRIQGITQYPNNLVQVYNRWGQLVFTMRGYDNNINIFEGKSNIAAIGRQELPDGVYYYAIDLGISANPITAFIVITR